MNMNTNDRTTGERTANDINDIEEIKKEKKPEINPGKLSPVPPPHVKHSETTAVIMSRVLIALLPAFVWAVILFGYRAVTLTLISVISCVLFEFLYQRIMRKPVRISDLSAAVTGILIAFSLPVNAPLWAPVVGGAFAVIIVKQSFGGIGKNIINPAAAARVFLFLSFNFMSAFQDIDAPKLSAFEINPTVTAGETPIYFLGHGLPPPSVSILDMILGQQGGSLGEVSALLLLAGAVYLMIRKVIAWHIPVSFIGAVALISFVFPPLGAEHVEFTIMQILTGGLILGAFFMATDYATSPVSTTGKIIFGAGCGFITIFIRYFGNAQEAVPFAVIIMNTLVWYIDRLTKPVKFGGVTKK